MTVSRDLFDESVHDLEPDLLVRLLPALEPQLDPHLMIITKELDCVVTRSTRFEADCVAI